MDNRETKPVSNTNYIFSQNIKFPVKLGTYSFKLCELRGKLNVISYNNGVVKFFIQDETISDLFQVATEKNYKYTLSTFEVDW